jgi:hypothetical protein
MRKSFARSGESSCENEIPKWKKKIGKSGRKETDRKESE